MISFLLLVIVLGAVLYLVEKFVPYPPLVIVGRVVVALILVFALLGLLGYAPPVPLR